MFINLYTSRIVLKALGVEQFGIYNVVGGIVILFSFLQGSLIASTQRFLNFEMGRPLQEQALSKVFSTGLIIHYLIAVCCLCLCEPIGLWLIYEKLNIEPFYLKAAVWVFQFSLISLLINLISIPYNALIISYERMSAFAYISVVEVSLKLFVALALTYVTENRLVVYAGLLCLVSLVVRIIYGLYCYRFFPHCRFKYVWDNSLIKQMFSFSGWMFSSSFTSLLSTQGVNILLNIFWGTVVNAARGIACQVQSAVGSFAVNFMMAVNPQIVKSYSTGDLCYMNKLIYSSSRFSFYLVLAMVVPLLLETKAVLHFWLGSVPEYTVLFTRLVLIDILFQSLFSPIATAIQATGNLKKYQLAISACFTLVFLITYVLFKCGLPVYSTFVISILISIIGIYIRLRVLKSTISFSIKKYIKEVGFPILKVLMFIIPVMVIYFYAISPELVLYQMLLKLFTSFSFVLICVWFIGINSQERHFIMDKIHVYVSRFFR